MRASLAIMLQVEETQQEHDSVPVMSVLVGPFLQTAQSV